MYGISPKIHFIAIGGSAMHNLAIALKSNGCQISGSDDEIFEPSKSNLQQHGLLPEKIGWNADNIHNELDYVILGMHAKADNPELLKAQSLGLKIYSYPEYIYEHSKNKQRVVVAGSHGKTTITSMIMHVLKSAEKEFDYLVGAKIDGFDQMAKLSDAPVIVIEGDEYLSSPIDRRPKFAHYQHHILVVSGIAWDHINVYPTFEQYKEQFENLIKSTPRAGTLIYCDKDIEVKKLAKPDFYDVTKIAYGLQVSKIKNGQTFISHDGELFPVTFFGEHNMYNVSAALKVCERLGVEAEEFFEAIQSFKGASSRLELLAQNSKTVIFKDFAHAPSKLKATTEAVSKQYADKKLIACLELHTFSSLNKEFLKQYKDTFEAAYIPVVYYNPETIKHKNLSSISIEDIKIAFNNKKLIVFNDSLEFKNYLTSLDLTGKALLLMSSGNFNGLNLKEFSKELIKE